MTRNYRSPLVVAGLLAVSTTAVMAADADGSQAGQWRASKLAGVPIYGPDNRTVGKITDVFMSKDGKATYVIIGVGGFLGIGEKDVAIPFEQIDFTDQPLTPPANPAPNNNLAAPAVNNAMVGGAATGTSTAAVGSMATTGGIAPATTVGLGTPSDTLGTASAPVVSANNPAVPKRSTAAPDHGTTALTVDQLKSAATFHFGS